MHETNKWIYSWNSVHITLAVIFYCTKQVKAMRLRCCTAHCNTHMPTGPGTNVLTHTVPIRWSEPTMHQSKGTPMCRKSVCAWQQSDTANTTAQYIKHMATKGYALIFTSYVFPQQTIVLYSMWRSHFKQQYKVFLHSCWGRDCAVTTTHGNIICWSLRTGLSTCIQLYHRLHTVKFWMALALRNCLNCLQVFQTQHSVR